MEFKKLKSTLHQAKGKNGIFQIEKSMGKWWPLYVGSTNNKYFRLPPKKELKEAKEMCKENAYWED